jgi:hypothetical protein
MAMNRGTCAEGATKKHDERKKVQQAKRRQMVALKVCDVPEDTTLHSH